MTREGGHSEAERRGGRGSRKKRREEGGQRKGEGREQAWRRGKDDRVGRVRRRSGGEKKAKEGWTRDSGVEKGGRRKKGGEREATPYRRGGTA